MHSFFVSRHGRFHVLTRCAPRHPDSRSARPLACPGAAGKLPGRGSRAHGLLAVGVLNTVPHVGREGRRTSTDNGLSPLVTGLSKPWGTRRTVSQGASPPTRPSVCARIIYHTGQHGCPLIPQLWAFLSMGRIHPRYKKRVRLRHSIVFVVFAVARLSVCFAEDKLCTGSSTRLPKHECRAWQAT